MKSIAALALLAGPAAAFAPAPAGTGVSSARGYAADLDSMIGVSAESGNKVVRASRRDA